MEDIVNAWTEWGKLEEVVVGRAENSCFIQEEPNFRGFINNKLVDMTIPWPEGRKKASIIDNAIRQLNFFVETLEGEGIRVHRPAPVDHYKPARTPSWSTYTQYGTTCPRDCMITVGNCVLEATMSKRTRYFEHLPYRHITRDLWKRDKNMQWKAAPKPSMDDDCFRPEFWEEPKPNSKRIYSLTEKEPIFEAADMIKCGMHFFILEGLSTNQAGIEWLRREFPNIIFNECRFHNELYPNHIDASLIPLRPPCDGEGGLVLMNSERPLMESYTDIWTRNGWKIINAPEPADIPVPIFSQCSKWLSMNILSLSENCVVIEENEKSLYNLLDSYGFDVITVPFRDVYEFGGSLHCTTWDIRRNDSCIDYFPN
ncbi:uncharacterized protein VTP21DRAFT_3522 [Calcarisporiella thermophila]|uniref:uncharacterized protein n=1 Tax=Calcarisporiella thermophila TaxID=911321 RepID=UPI00374382D6